MPAESCTVALSRLLALNWGFILLASLGLLVAAQDGMALPWPPMLATLATLALGNMLAALWTRRASNVSPWVLAVALALDCTALGVLLFFSGGANNPLVTLYLLPLVYAALTLPRRQAWWLAVLAVADYTFLMDFFIPLPGSHSDPALAFRLHTVGMWATFCGAAALMVGLISKMTAELRARDRALRDFREKQLRDEQWVALGTLAASAAHELGTPLSTLAVLIGEWRRAPLDNPDLHEDLDLMHTQVDACKAALNRLASEAGVARAASRQAADAYMAQLLRQWRTLRPDVAVRYQPDPAAAPQLALDAGVTAALLNLLNNAADASPQEVDIHTNWSGEAFCLTIRNRGPGLSPSLLAAAGTPGAPSSKGGMGLGVALAHATFERLGGEVRLRNRAGGGVEATVILPWPKENAS